MESKLSGVFRSGYSFSRIVCAAVAVLLLPAVWASAQNLFVLESTSVSGFPPPPPTGLILNFTPAGSGSIFVSGSSPSYGVVFDTAGNLFEADQTSGNIYEFTNHADVLSSNLTVFASGLYEPKALAFDNTSNLFEVDFGSQNANTGFMHKFSSGVESTFASGLNPTALAIDRSNNVYVTDTQSQSIYKFTPDGVKSTFVSGLSHPSGLVFDSAGNLFEADNGSGHIYEFISNNGILSSNPVAFASDLSFPYGLAFDSSGNLFECDYGSGNIYRFTTNGVRSTFASGLNHPANLAFQPIPELKADATNGTFQISVLMPSPYHFTILQTSTDLIHWINIDTNIPPFVFKDSIATTSLNHFYRALLGP